MALPKPVLESLRRIVGDRHVIDQRHDLVIFERDASIADALPEAVVLPGSREEVVEVVRLAARHRIPVVPGALAPGYRAGPSRCAEGSPSSSAGCGESWTSTPSRARRWWSR